MKTRDVLVLSANDVDQCLTMKEAIESMKDAFVELTDGQAAVPPRQVVPMPASDGQILSMPAYSPHLKKCGLKFLTLMGRNPSQGLPLIHAVYLLADAEDGRPLALIDGERLTALRTGAASGVATDILARPQAKTVAIFGAGVQGRSQLEAVCNVRPIERAFVIDPDPSKAHRFCDEMASRLGLQVTPRSSSEALLDAEIICTATTSPTPVFQHPELRPGVHINAVGTFRPTNREIPGETVRAARVVVDARVACLEEAGDLIMTIQDGLITDDHIHGELGELISGKKPGRSSGDEITLFKSVGNAIQDLYAASRVYSNALEKGHGHVAAL
jgi:ornithine cyclodeaminase/alanine dehydrogenase-like protein (mu-crystallin family)